MTNIFFTSDHHFFHKGVLVTCALTRKFSSVEEMNSVMIDRWNNTIKENDIIYYLGDFSLGKNDETVQLMNSLNGNIYFIKGNHDKWTKKPFFNYRFNYLNDVYNFRMNRQLYVLCHYPLREWEGCYNGSYHLYGHTHKDIKDFGFSLNVGVDLWDFYPVSIDTINLVMKTKINNFIQEKNEIYTF